MNTAARLVLLSLALIASRDAAAQLFKCTDAAGKITYSSMKCSELKLKDAGEVPDRIQITPAIRSQPAARPGAQSERNEPSPKPAASAEPDKPERRCFTVNLGGGKTATRCNDKPDE